MHFRVNGKTLQGFWRIDDVYAERTGIDFVKHPTALVESKELAELIVRLLNQYHADPSMTWPEIAGDDATPKG